MPTTIVWSVRWTRNHQNGLLASSSQPAHRRIQYISLQQHKISVFVRDTLGEDRTMKHHPVSTPVDGYESLTAATASEPRTDQLEYQKRIGSLMYAMTSTRPDIAFAVAKLSQFSHDPCVRHRVALDRVMKYLRGTLKLGLVFSSSDGVNPIGYAGQSKVYPRYDPAT